MRQVCHRLLGVREKAAEIQLDGIRERVRVRGIPVEDGEWTFAPSPNAEGQSAWLLAQRERERGYVWVCHLVFVAHRDLPILPYGDSLWRFNVRADVDPRG